MALDPFDNLLELENDFYRQGYDAGIADSAYAGMIEGKVFGIEKGSEKALALGKLRGRALVWQGRMPGSKTVSTGKELASPPASTSHKESASAQSLDEVLHSLGPLPDNARLRKHVEALLAATDGEAISRDNTDEAVSEFDDRITRARAKAKVIANIVGEPFNPTPSTNSGIEDATGLQARH